MAQAPLKQCPAAGCKKLTRQGRCENHQVIKRTRGKSREWQHLYGRKWNKARKQFLTENPLCVDCKKEGRIKAASVVDHMIPHRGDLTLFWDRSNWQGQCTEHHNQKTARGE